jgi:transposase
MSYKGSFTKEEWMLLESAPLLVFYMVAGIDKKIDKKEIDEFMEQVTHAPLHSKPFGQEVYAGLHADLRFLLEASSKINWVDGLKNVRLLLARIPTDEARDFKAGLVYLAEHVAKSSGGFLQEKLSDDEKKAIGFVIAVLEGQI